MTDPIKAEPVAWMYHANKSEEGFMQPNKANMDPRHWTETPLYTHAQLVEERRLAWNEAIEAAATVTPSKTAADECETVGQWTRRTMREAIRALTKENSDASSD